MLYRVVFRTQCGREEVKTCNLNKVEEYKTQGLSVVSMEAQRPPVVHLPVDLNHENA